MQQKGKRVGSVQQVSEKTKMRKGAIILLGLILLARITELIASEGTVTKLPMPRFVSLRSKKVNTRVGPGSNYPLEWHYSKQYLPVEIIAEFEEWRQIRDPDGSASWIHQRLLSNKRHVMVTTKTRKLFQKPDLSERIIAMVEPNVVGRLIECNPKWCKIDFGLSQGWIKRAFLFGVTPQEKVP